MRDIDIEIHTVKSTIRSMMVRAKTELARFHEKFLDAPSYSLSWADSAFEYAAKLDVAKEISILTDTLNEENFDDVMGKVKQLIMSNMVRGAKNPVRSTSTCSHLMGENTTAEWASIYDTFSGYFGG